MYLVVPWNGEDSDGIVSVTGRNDKSTRPIVMSLVQLNKTWF